MNICKTVVLASLALAGGCLSENVMSSDRTYSEQKRIDELYPYCCLEYDMHSYQFNEFLNHLSWERALSIIQAVNQEYEANSLEQIISDIKKEFVWKSSHWITYGFKDAESIDYDKTVRWVAEKILKEEKELHSLTTFQVERLICEAFFEQIWDHMSVEDREKTLKDMKIEGIDSNQIAGIAALGGSAALATLSTTIIFSGCAFYTGLSTFICSAAAIVGVSLPFGVYTGAAATAALLGGPIGWGLIALGSVGGAALLGSANYQKTAQMIIAIHLIKVDALEKSGVSIEKFLR